jgi:phenolic acid decarboxylase
MHKAAGIIKLLFWYELSEVRRYELFITNLHTVAGILHSSRAKGIRVQENAK